MVPASPRAALPTRTAYGGKPARISPHQVIEWDRWRGGENRLLQREHAALEWLGSHPEIIQPKVQEKGQTHQFVITHYIIFVPINRVEPPPVPPHEIPVVPLDRFFNRFSSRLSQ